MCSHMQQDMAICSEPPRLGAHFALLGMSPRVDQRHPHEQIGDNILSDTLSQECAAPHV